MASVTDIHEQLLGFFGLFDTPPKDGYIGGMLVTDFQGVPQEFRCTHPVRPTTVQKLLYGKTLEHHIGIKLCGEPLIRAIQNKPNLILVNREFLLDTRINSPCPVVFVRRAGDALEITSGGAERASKRERILSPSGRFQPIVIDCHPEFGQDITPAGEAVEKVFAYFDPVEPFERMLKAIEVLGKQSKWFD